MKKEETRLFDRCGRKNAFKVPEGYFEDFAGRMMDRLPEKMPVGEETVSLWMRVKPWIYMAAMFCGIMLMVRMFVGEKESTAESDFPYINLTELPDEYIDPIVNQTMMDDYTLYQYLTDVNIEIYN